MTGRVLLYVQHLLGVGHLSRAAAIARGLGEAGLSVTVVTGGEPVEGLSFGVARVVQLPPIKAADLTFRVLLDEAGAPVGQALEAERRRMLLAAYRDHKPHVLITEHYPFGRRKFTFELEPLLDLAKGRAAILCSVRDVLVEKGGPDRAAKVTKALQRWFDAVLVHGDGAVVPLSATFPAATEIAGLIRYTGYIVNRTEASDLPATGGDGHGEVIVSVGGGAVGEGLLASALAARAQGCLADRTWRLLAGANVPEPAFQALRAQAPERTIVERARPDFRTLLTRCSLSISQAGYNTLMDVVEAGCPSLMVPFAGGSESEQLFRARIFEAKGYIRILEERELSPGTLAEAATATAARGRRVVSRTLDLGGIETTARIVAGFAAGRSMADVRLG